MLRERCFTDVNLKVRDGFRRDRPFGENFRPRQGRRFGNKRVAEALQQFRSSLNEHLDLAGAVSHPALNTAAVRHAIDKRAKSHALDATAQYQFSRDARGHCVSLGAILSLLTFLNEKPNAALPRAC